MMHRLKILPAHFEQVKRGVKTFEIRDNNDRGFQKGDLVELKEFEPGIAVVGRYTGKELLIEISYVTNYMQQPGYVVFGFTVLEPLNQTGNHE